MGAWAHMDLSTWAHKTLLGFGGAGMMDYTRPPQGYGDVEYSWEGLRVSEDYGVQLDC